MTANTPKLERRVYPEQKTLCKMVKKIVYSHYEYNMDKILQSEKLRPLFEKHCKTELNLELLQFCERVDKFKQAPTLDAAKEIMNQYILSNSERELNLNDNIRMQVDLDIKEFEDKAQQHRKILESSLVADAPDQNQEGEVITPLTPSTAQLKQLQDLKEQEFKTQLKAVFDISYAQVRMSLYNSFSRFKRSKDFITFIQTQNDSFIRTIGTHKSEIQNIVLQLENFETPQILDSDIAFANECSNDYYYWRPLFHSKEDKTTLWSANNKHQFFSADVKKKTKDLFEMKHEYSLPMSALHLLNAFFSKDHIAGCTSLHNISIIEVNADAKYPSTVFTGQLFCGKIAQLRDLVCVAHCHYDSVTNSYVVIIRNCEHPKAPKLDKKSIRGHYYWIYRFYDMGNCCKLQAVVIGNSHGYLETKKGVFFDLMIKFGANELFQQILQQFGKIQFEQVNKHEDVLLLQNGLKAKVVA